MEYCTAKDIANQWEISSRMVSIYCKEHRITGAIKLGNMWLIPVDADKPEDLRKNNGRKGRCSK